MCEIMDELRQEVHEATLLNDVKSLMETTKWSAEQAMDALKIPADLRKKLAAKL